MPISLTSNQVTEAFELASKRVAMPTALGTKELRATFTRSMRERAHVMAAVVKADFANAAKEAVDRVLMGSSKAVEIANLQELLQSMGYTPEAGFPGFESYGIKPAKPGSIRDISSWARLDLIIETETALAAGKVQQLQGFTQSALYYSPAWEMVRSHIPKDPRDWPKRWQKAGGPPLVDGRFIAPKKHGVWAKLGSSALFDDALDVDHAPFWFNSTGSLSTVSRGMCIKLGLMLEDGQWAETYAPNGKAPVITPALPPAPVNDKGMQPVISDRLRKLIELQKRNADSQRRAA